MKISGADSLQVNKAAVELQRLKRMLRAQYVDLLLLRRAPPRHHQFCLEIVADFHAGHYQDTKGLAELLESVEQIRQRFRSRLAPGSPRSVRDVEMNIPEAFADQPGRSNGATGKLNQPAARAEAALTLILSASMVSF